MNKEIYGIGGTGKNSDDSMYFEKLPPNEAKKVWDDIYAKILRFSNGKIYSDAEFYDEKNIYKSLRALVVEFNRLRIFAYSGKNQLEKTIKSYKDDDFMNRAKKVFDVFNKYAEVNSIFFDKNSDQYYGHLRISISLAGSI